MKPRQLQEQAHPSFLGWQMDWPVFVKTPVLTVSGKVFKRGDYFPWSELQVDPSRVALMYNQKLLNHDANKVQENGLGDRLGEINGRDLKSLVHLLNTDMRKNHCATEEEFKRKRCRQSAKPETQRIYLRQFLNKNPYMSEAFLKYRESYLDKKVET